MDTNTFSEWLREPVMALTRVSRLVVVFGSSLAMLGLMMASVDPEIQYSVDEIIDNPDKYQDSQVFVRGVVSFDSINNEEAEFILEGVSGSILVDFSDAPIPDGFDEGRTIAVRGNLEMMNGIWVIESFEIQTGCPSKYES
ncbi:MAG: cytochrome c maturation protein CcmE [Candidatus Thermoplasmatota archaeon]|nr:cytochrome c maturation protein CcmE [Candidatus Thermoplasmatota archaeon]